MGEPAGTEPERRDGGLLDADRFLDLTQRLRDLHARVDGARISDEQRARWQRRILHVTEVAQVNLDRAADQLERLTAELERHLRRR